MDKGLGILSLDAGKYVATCGGAAATGFAPEAPVPLLSLAALLAYGLAVWLVVHLFVVGYEEPTLLRAHGDEYAAFRANVPRWIPRLRPWLG